LSEAGEEAVVFVERQGAVATIWINRPDVLNAISLEVKAAIVAAIEAADQDKDVGAIILAGRGRVFSSGADRKLLAKLEHAGRTERVEAFEQGAKLTHAMLNTETPIIAVLEGYAVGGGVSLALAADIILAAEKTIFFIPEVGLGIPFLWGSTPMLAASLGMHRARNLVLTCDRFSVEDAERWGLVRSIHPKEKLFDEAFKLAEHLAEMPRQAMARQKQMNTRLVLRYMEWLKDEIYLAFDDRSD
jgi:enoyl-CoA hydratase/carnithine racemase